MEDVKRKSLPNEPLLGHVAELVSKGHNVTIRVRGNSMNPFFIDRRDEVILSPFTDRDIKVGAVILARDERDRIVFHRIIRIKGDDIVMMGDGNVRGVEHTNINRVLGLLTGGIRNGKAVDCTGFAWRFFSIIWRFLLPMRRLLLAVWRRTRHNRKWFIQDKKYT